MNSTTLIVLAVVGVAVVAFMATSKNAATQTNQTPQGTSAFTFGLSVPIK